MSHNLSAFDDALKQLDRAPPSVPLRDKWSRRFGACCDADTENDDSAAVSADRAIRAALDRDDVAMLSELADAPTGAFLLHAWASANAADPAVHLANIVAVVPPAHGRAIAAIRLRLGPLVDALACVAQAPRMLEDPRVGILAFVGELATARCAPLAALWIDPRHRARILRGSRLWDRAVASRLLWMCSDAIESRGAAPDKLLLHDVLRLARDVEPVVWIPAVRALGRLAGRVPAARRELERWSESDVRLERRRSVTALGSIPAIASNTLQTRLRKLGQSDADPHELAALGPSIPTIATEWPDQWHSLATRLIESDAPVVASAVDGLSRLAFDGCSVEVAELLERARQRAESAHTLSSVEAGYWSRVRQVTTRCLHKAEPDDIWGQFCEMLTAITDHQIGLEDTVIDAYDASAQLLEKAHALWAKHYRTITDRSVDAGTLGAADALLDDLSIVVALEPWRALSGAGSETVHGERELWLADAMTRGLAVWCDAGGFAPGHAALRTVRRLVRQGHSVPTTRRTDWYRVLVDGRWSSVRSELKRHRRSLGELLRSVSSRHISFASIATWCLCNEVSIEVMKGVRETAPDSLASLDPFLAAVADGTSLWSHGQTDALDAALASMSLSLLPIARVHSDLARAIRGVRGSIAVGEHAPVLRALADFERALRGFYQWTEQLTEANSPVVSTPVHDRIAAAALPRLTPTDRDALLALAGVYRSALRPIVEALAQAVAGEMKVSATIQMAAPSMESTRAPSADGSGRSHPDTVPEDDYDAEASATLVPTSLGDYTVDREIGRGGQSVVYRVYSKRLANRMFALKLPLDTESAKTMSNALLSELKRLAAIYHPNVINVVDTGTYRGRPYLVTDFLVGTTVARYFRPPVRYDNLPLVAVLRDVCAALGSLSRQGFVHRDIKPDNLFVQLDLDAEQEFEHSMTEYLAPLRTVVLDFGITTRAHGSEDTRIAGTPGFIAPEVFNGRRHPRTDVYGLAGVAHWLLTGECFFEPLVRSGNLAAVAIATLSGPAPTDALQAAGVPPRIIQLIQDASQVDPAGRPTASEFLRTYLLAAGRG